MLTTSAFLYLLPYLVSLFLSLAVGWYAWQRRSRLGATQFALLAFCGSLYTLGAIFENISVTLDAKIFWDLVQWPPSVIQPLAFLAFATRFTKINLPAEKWVWRVFYIYSIGIILFAITDPSYHWLISKPYLVSNEPFSVLLYKFTPWVYLFAVTTYAILLTAFGILIANIVRAPRIYRMQAFAIIIGMAIPMIGILFAVFEISTPFPQRDMTPITFGITNAIFAWSLFRFRLFDVTPIARNLLVEEMQDGLVVIDTSGKVVDVNPAMEKILQTPRASVIGVDQQQVFAKWPSLIEKYKDVKLAREEIEFGRDEQKRYFDFSISPLYDKNQKLVGRLVVLRDTTASKTAEIKLQDEKAKIELFARNVEALRALSEFLQASLTPQEAGAFIARQIITIFPETKGALYISHDARSELMVEARWGNTEGSLSTINLEDCWGLRRGRMYQRHPESANLECNHILAGASVESLCLPLVAQGENMGLISFWVNEKTSAGQRYFSNERQNLAIACADSIALALANLRLRARLNDAFGRFISPEIAKEVLRRGASLGGTTVIATVLFADIRGFTSLSETLTPQDVVGFLNRYFAVMEPAIASEGGWINKFGGDSLLAVFGTPTPYPDHAARAVRAAQNMRVALARLNEEQARNGRPIVRFGVGVHSGELVAGNVGSPTRMEYTIIGDMVNTTQRIDEPNKTWETDILISEQAYSLLGAGYSARAMPPAMVKGKSKPIQVYALE